MLSACRWEESWRSLIHSRGPCLFGDNEIPSSTTIPFSFLSLPQFLGPWALFSSPTCSLGISVHSHRRDSPLSSTLNIHLVVTSICISQRHLTFSHSLNLGLLLCILCFSKQSPNISGRIEQKFHTFISTIPQAYIWSTFLS